ncbi:MAG: hypothetical protein ABSA26_14035 [Thermoguttaceae bacterium]
MNLLLNSVLLPLWFMAAEAEIPLNERYPQAFEAFQCNFDPACDANFDGWPDGWTRRRGQGYPSYLKIKIQPAPADLAAHGPRQCLRVDLDGGGAAVFSTPIEVGAVYSYVLEGMLHTDNLRHDRAFLSVTFLDADKHPLVTFESEETADNGAWKKISLGPLAPPGRETKLAFIGLHVEPRGAEDLKGSAAFADIRLIRLPRLELKTNHPFNFFLEPAKVEVTCTASGCVEKNTEITFKLFDALGRCLADDTRKLGEKAGDVSGDPQGDAAESTAAKACIVIWQPPIPGPGFYRVRAELHGRGAALQCRDLTLAAVEPRQAPAGGEFGWTLPNAGHPIPLAQLSPLLSQAGINWVKYPLWFAEKNGAQTLNQFLDFGEQLNIQGIEVVGLLNDPPEDVRERFAAQSPLSAAEIFGAEAKIWYPSLELVVSQLSGQVRCWQLGDDTDTSFSTDPEFVDKLTGIKKELDRAAKDINLGIGWDCRNVLPAETAGRKLPWRFTALSSRQPLSPQELAAYLDADKDSPQKRWVSLKPLPKILHPNPLPTAGTVPGEGTSGIESDSITIRAGDLVKQMIAAKIHGADAIFCPDPFDVDCGLMNKDGTPGDLFLPWRTTALELGGARFLGSMQLPRGSQNMIFARANDAVMVLWNDKPAEEVLYLGEDVKQVDMWGRARKPDIRENAQVIHVDSLPAFVTGLSKPIARWYIDFSFAQERMPSIAGQAQANGFRVKNPFPGEATATATIVAPRGWIVNPKQVFIHLTPNEELQQPISITFPDTATSGRHAVRVEFEIQADRPYKFSVLRHIEVGLGDVRIETKTRLSSENKLQVEQRFINSTAEPVSFRCELFAPDRRRLMVDVLGQSAGENPHTYRLEDGKELLGKTLWLRATEIGGPRILNYRFTVKEGIGDRE